MAAFGDSPPQRRGRNRISPLSAEMSVLKLLCSKTPNTGFVINLRRRAYFTSGKKFRSSAMFSPFIENLTVPVFAVSLSNSLLSAILHLPGRPPREQCFFQLPSPEKLLTERLSAYTASRNALYLYGQSMGADLPRAITEHVHAGLGMTMHPRLACSLSARADKLETLGITVSSVAPPLAVSLKAEEFEADAWRMLLDTLHLPQPELILIAADEYGRPFDMEETHARRFAVDSLFVRHNGGGIELFSLLAAGPDEHMPRLSAIKQTSGAPVLDHIFAFALGLLAAPRIAGRSLREGLTLLHVDGLWLRAALVFQNRLFSVLEVPLNAWTQPPAGNAAPDSLARHLEDFRLGWLPQEVAASQGGFVSRAACLPPEAEGFRPTFICGNNAEALALYGQRVGSFFNCQAASCWGLLHAYSSLDAAERAACRAICPVMR